MYYGINGEPISVEQWGNAMQNMEDKIVARDVIDGFLVSTVWLGVNHNFDGGEPIIFETMIFPEGNWSEVYMDRYSTREQALAGHEVAIAWLKENK